MRIDSTTILDAVAEPGIDKVDAVLPYEQKDVVVYRGYARGDGNIERNRGPVVLRHVDRDGIASDLGLRLEEPEIIQFRVPSQCSGHAKARDPSTDNGDPSRTRRVILIHGTYCIIFRR